MKEGSGGPRERPPTLRCVGEVVWGGGCCRAAPSHLSQGHCTCSCPGAWRRYLGATWPRPSPDLVSLSLSGNSKVPRSPAGATSPRTGAAVLTEAGPAVRSAAPGPRRPLGPGGPAQAGGDFAIPAANKWGRGWEGRTPAPPGRGRGACVGFRPPPAAAGRTPLRPPAPR